MRNLGSRFLAVLLGSLVLIACGKAQIGEACGKSGSTDECVDGAICDTDQGRILCLKRCSSDTDCITATEQCTGVSGSNLKACHKK